MSRLDEAKAKLLEVHREFILNLNLTENSRWTNEHKILFLVRHEFPFSDAAERKELVLIDMDAMKAIFMEDPNVDSYLNIMNDPLFASRKDPETVVKYYKKVIKLKGMCLGSMGNFFDNLAMFDEAETCFLKYIELLENNFGLEHQVVSNAYFTLGTFYFKRGLLQKPLMCFQKARDIRVKRLGEEHASVIDCDLNSLIVLSEMKKSDNAILLFKKVEKLTIKTEGNLSLKLARLYFVVSSIYSQKENDEQALNYLDKAKFITNKVGESAANAYGVAQLRQEEDALFEEFDKQTFGKYFENFKESFAMFEMLKGTTLMK